jgi:hypothetical protein
MDRERLEALEAQVLSVVEELVRVRAENQRLSQNNKQLQDALRAQQREVERLQPDQEELTHLRTVMHTFQQERDLIRQKLEQMLATVEWLEAHTHMDGGTKA